VINQLRGSLQDRYDSAHSSWFQLSHFWSQQDASWVILYSYTFCYIAWLFISSYRQHNKFTCDRLVDRSATLRLGGQLLMFILPKSNSYLSLYTGLIHQGHSLHIAGDMYLCSLGNGRSDSAILGEVDGHQHV
jgi:hypothetical protein